MTRTDTATRKVTTIIVLAVGLFAGGDSYSHVFSLARSHGQDVISAALLPLAGDNGVIAAASSVMLVAARQRRPVPLRARIMLIAGIAATVAANIAYGLAHGRTDALLSVWPVAAYCGCVELLAWMRQNTGMQSTRPKAAPADAPGDADAAHQTVVLIKDHKHHRMYADSLLNAAEREFRGRVPTLREIQRTLHIGQPRAQEIKAYLASLQAA